ncbi:uncharacterized protein LOC123550419 [Mercenaria mercenaria]|uniref:uncharacterized protein LOC123550419 n=1 Tax=Mercenaria mercenaria TaxID=6596 RepID=UPI00234EA931|nr:uncharacterized protein LOC123550419 [Mercenaria mercenaria]
MAEVGYGYTRQETMNLATDYATELGLRTKDDRPVSDKWLYNFLGRWPELKLKKPRALEIARAKSATRDAVDNYFTELKRILVKYDLEDKPNRIFNVDEKGLNTEHKPPKVVAGKFNKTQAVTSGKSKTTTVIGCVNGIGQQVPPFYIFPGALMIDGLMEGSTPGSKGTVSPTGWSNTEMFCQYMKDHLLKYLPSRDNDYVLVLYDGHKSHCSLGLIEWAKSEKIILFVLPPHCSHILQPLDVSCFGPFEVAWNSACQKYMRESGGRLITRYDVCQLACKVYSSTLTVPNIVAAFKRCGIHPFNSAVVSDSVVAPATTFKSQNPPPTESSGNSNVPKSAENFLLRKGGKILENVQSAKKERKTLSKVIGGKPITEEEMIDKIKDHNDKQKKCSNSKRKTVKSPVVSTSGLPVKRGRKSQHAAFTIDSVSEEEIGDEEKCIICKKFSPDTTKFPFIIIVKWGCCDRCNGWVHLAFCTPVRVLRCGVPFLCPNCENIENEQ